MQPKVFVPNIPTRFEPLSGGRVPTINLNPAMEYGDLVPCISAEVNVRDYEVNDLLAGVQESLRNCSKHDYILCVGDPILIAAAIAYAHDINGEAKVLRWDRSKKSYDVVEVVL